MDDSGPTASMIWLFVLLLIDVFFYGFGAAVLSLNEKEVQRRAEEDKDKKSIWLSRIMQTPEIYINTLQLVVTLFHVLFGAFYLRRWGSLLTKWLTGLVGRYEQFAGIPAEVIAVTATVFSVAFLIYLLLTFGILLPKRIAVRMPERWAYASIRPVYFLTHLFLPLTGLVNKSVRGILFLCGLREDRDESDVTEEEIISMVNEGHEQGLIQASEAEMISNIFEYGDKEAQDIMTHRNHIEAIDASTTLSEAIAVMLAGKNSRYPVYEENIDHIVGILHLKDALRFHVGEGGQDVPLTSLQGLLREPKFVPQTRNIDELFKEMQQNKVQMVIVVDEYGQTVGLVAMEDILEEIVGNILDEYDEDREYIEDKGNDEYVVEGMTPLEELEELLGISFEEENFETLNGFLIARLDRIPEPDEQFSTEYAGYRFKILSVEHKMIARVLVTKLTEQEGQERKVSLEQG